MRILTGSDIRFAISMKEAIGAVREGFIALSAGHARAPLRGVMETSDGVMLTMPAHIKGDPVNVVKVVSVCPENVRLSLPTIHAVVLITDTQTGSPLALLEGATLTALRTGAASGLATDLLARPNASLLGIVGAGAQARTQVEAVCAVRPISEIRIFSLQGAEAMAQEFREKYDVQITITDSAYAALVQADVIVAATNSRSPVVNCQDVASGTHINGIGSFTPEMQEVAANVVANAKVVVDHRPSAWAEAGDLIIPHNQGLITKDHIYAEIGEVAAGLVEGRTNPEEITFFKSVGNAVQDATVARRVFDAAVRLGLGTEVDL